MFNVIVLSFFSVEFHDLSMKISQKRSNAFSEFDEVNIGYKPKVSMVVVCMFTCYKQFKSIWDNLDKWYGFAIYKFSVITHTYSHCKHFKNQSFISLQSPRKNCVEMNVRRKKLFQAENVTFFLKENNNNGVSYHFHIEMYINDDKWCLDNFYTKCKWTMIKHISYGGWMWLYIMPINYAEQLVLFVSEQM